MASSEHDELLKKFLAENPGGPVPEKRPSNDELAAALAFMNSSALDIDDDVRSEDATVGGVPGIWFRPAGTEKSGKALIYFHGGGYMFGCARNTGHVTARLAKAAGVPAFSVDYRLSWQAPFPAALEDAVRVYRGLLDAGYDASSIAFTGDSAGGGLAIALLLAVRDAGLALPAGAYASSAFTDLAVTGPSATSVDDPIATVAGLRMLAAGYLDGADPRDPRASPLYGDLRGLPPLLLHVGTRELLLDDTTRLAARAKKAGVEVSVEAYEGVIHIWQYFGPDLPETAESEKAAGAFLAACLKG